MKTFQLHPHPQHFHSNRILKMLQSFRLRWFPFEPHLLHLSLKECCAQSVSFTRVDGVSNVKVTRRKYSDWKASGPVNYFLLCRFPGRRRRCCHAIDYNTVSVSQVVPNRPDGQWNQFPPKNQSKPIGQWLGDGKGQGGVPTNQLQSSGGGDSKRKKCHRA